MPAAGDLRERVRFEKRVEVADGAGNTVGDWQPQFERAAAFIMRPGSEALLAARLQGQQPVTAIVRYDSETVQITPEWRLVDVRNGNRVYDIRAVEDMERRRQWISIVAVSGGPA